MIIDTVHTVKQDNTEAVHSIKLANTDKYIQCNKITQIQYTQCSNITLIPLCTEMVLAATTGPRRGPISYTNN